MKVGVYANTLPIVMSSGGMYYRALDGIRNVTGDQTCALRILLQLCTPTGGSKEKTKYEKPR